MKGEQKEYRTDLTDPGRRARQPLPDRPVPDLIVVLQAGDELVPESSPASGLP